MKMKNFGSLLAIHLALFLPVTAYGEQEVVLKPGAKPVTLKGKLAKGKVNTYLLKANSGQTLTIYVASPDRSIVARIDPPGRYQGYLMDGSSWTGPLPNSGQYRIEVYSGYGQGDYSLELELR